MKLTKNKKVSNLENKTIKKIHQKKKQQKKHKKNKIQQKKFVNKLNQIKNRKKKVNNKSLKKKLFNKKKYIGGVWGERLGKIGNEIGEFLGFARNATTLSENPIIESDIKKIIALKEFQKQIEDILKHEINKLE